MKKISVITLALLLLASGGAFANQEKTIQDLLYYFSNQFNVTDQKEVYYQMVLASDGCRVTVDDTRIEIYKFDASNPHYKEFIAAAKEMAISLSESFNVKTYVYVNDSFMITMSTVNEKIIKAFEKFL